MRVISATQQAQQRESQRRLAWEREQEARNAQRQADMEHRVSAMFEEIKALRSTLDALNSSNSASAVVSPPNTASPPSSQLPTTPASIQPASPTSPLSQPALTQSHPQRMLDRELPNNCSPASPTNYYRDRSNSVQTQPYQQHSFQVSSVPSNHDLLTPGTSPQLAESSARTYPTSPRPRKRRKERDFSPSSEGGSSSSSSSSVARRPRKRRNNHDTQCYTIHVRWSELSTESFLYTNRTKSIACYATPYPSDDGS
jgi:hypothetical protein